jgi:urea carboxylase
VAAGDVVAIVESMKMEIAVTAPVAGRLHSLTASPGDVIRAGEVVAVLDET